MNTLDVGHLVLLRAYTLALQPGRRIGGSRDAPYTATVSGASVDKSVGRLRLWNAVTRPLRALCEDLGGDVLSVMAGMMTVGDKA